MSTEKEGKMWLLHCQLLTEIMAQILKKKESTGEELRMHTFLKGIIGKLTARFTDMIGDIVKSQGGAEYAFFRDHIKPKNGNDTNLKNEIFTIIDGLSGPAYRAASTLMRKGFERNEPMITYDKEEETALWCILLIGYLNRKFCLGAEGVVKKDGEWYKKMEKKRTKKNVSDILEVKDKKKKKKTKKEKDSNAMLLFLNCLRPRLNYIGAIPWRKKLFKNRAGKNEIVEYSVTDLVKLFERLSNDKTLDVPFSKQIHRLRGIPGNNPLDAHLLGIDAGAHSNAITQESTLGKIRQSLGLPLRCDISGTTVDAMGFCDTFIKKTSNSNKEERMVYLVSCMLGMCLTGHHSLDEMALALSLDVNEKAAKYDPCNPASVIGLLKEWSGWHDFEFSNDKYYNSKAKGIINIKCLETLEFTRKLWDDLATHNKIMKGWKYDNDKDKDKLEPPEKEK